MRAAARCGRPGPGGGRGRGHIWTRRQPPATSWRRRLQAAAAAGSCARGGGGDPGARTRRTERPRAAPGQGAWPRLGAGPHWSVRARRANPGRWGRRPRPGTTRDNGRAPRPAGGGASAPAGSGHADARHPGAGPRPALPRPGDPAGYFPARPFVLGQPGTPAWRRARGRAPLCPPSPAREGRRRSSFPPPPARFAPRGGVSPPPRAGPAAAPGGGTTPAAPTAAALLGGRARRPRAPPPRPRSSRRRVPAGRGARLRPGLSRGSFPDGPRCGPRCPRGWDAPAPSWRLSWQRGCRAPRRPVLAGASYVRCSGNAGPLPPPPPPPARPGRLPASPRCPSPAAVGAASNAAGRGDPAHAPRPPAVEPPEREETLGCAQLPAHVPRTPAPSPRRPAVPEWPARSCLQPGGRAQRAALPTPTPTPGTPVRGRSPAPLALKAPQRGGRAPGRPHRERSPDTGPLWARGEGWVGQVLRKN